MAILPVILEAIWRLAALGLGCWMAYTEATGTYDFYLEQAGGVVTFLVRATVGITLATAILPFFMSRAIKQRRPLRALNILVAFVLCVSVILVAGVSRTGAPQDLAKAQAREAKRKLETAKANVNDAEGALSTNKMLVEGECRSGVGKQCKGLARDSKGTLETTIQLRTKLGEVKEVVEDNTDKRLSALTLGIVSPDQAETIRPLLMPVTLSFVAGLLITLAFDHDLPTPAPKGGKGWRSRREKPDMATAPAYPANVSPKPEIIDMTPEPAPTVPARVPVRPRPKLASTTRQPIGSALDFLHEAVEIVEGSTRIEMSDACIGYAAWCKAKSLRPMSPGEFFNEMSDLCAQFGIPIQEEAGSVYLLNVRLVAAKEGTHG